MKANHILGVCVCVCLVANPAQLFCNPVDCSLPDSSVHEFPRQEYWTRLPFPSPGDLPSPGIELTSSPLQAGRFFTTEPPGKPHARVTICFIVMNSSLKRKQSFYRRGHRGSEGSTSLVSGGAGATGRSRLSPAMRLGSLHLLKPVSKYVGAGGVGVPGPPFLGQATVSQWPLSEKPSLSENLIFPSTPFPYLHLAFPSPPPGSFAR